MQHPSPMEIFGKYMAWKRNRRTWIISFMDGTQFMYLLEGTRRALLIDTGWGAGNLRSFVKRLTDKPTIVANTHYHPDHAGGNGEWPEAYMHPDWRLDEGSMANTPCDLSKLPYPFYAHRTLADGEEIELGNRRVEVLHRTAHSNSSLFFLDHGEKMLFCGDELESAQVLLYAIGRPAGTGYDLRARLIAHRVHSQELLLRKDEWQDLCPSHNGAPISSEYVEDYIALVDHIFAGDATVEDELNHRFIERDPIASQLCRVRWRGASFFVKKAELREVWGEKTLLP